MPSEDLGATESLSDVFMRQLVIQQHPVHRKRPAEEAGLAYIICTFRNLIQLQEDFSVHLS